MQAGNLTEEQQLLSTFTEKAYLDYAMYVILDRALPDIADGLKPVQRRLIYSMNELGLSANSKYKKSARTVGDTLGKYHPHGDTACYEAMVLMAQPFAYRYRLVDGQGNWGSSDDPKSFAAMRYTESRLTAYAKTLLQELDLGTVEWKDNYDGTSREPKRLPARLPNILINGSSGIAVGMSTDIVPHNLREVASACCALLENPELSTAELMEYIPAPDFPTGAELVSAKSDIFNLYETGSGSVKLRAKYLIEDGNIIIFQLPYQVSGAKIQEQIAKQMQDKKLPWLEDLRDESDHENPIRLVLVPRSNRVDINRLMDHLFATTDLEKNYRAHFNMIGLNGRPQVKSLRSILLEWLEFREATVNRRLQNRLDALEERLAVLSALLIAFLNLDEVIRIIRYEDEPEKVLIARFKISQLQAQAILDTKLKHLAKLEEIKIREEEAKLQDEKSWLLQLLNDKNQRIKLISEEIKLDAETYGDPRRTMLVERQAASALSDEEIGGSEPIAFILSKKGLVRGAKAWNIDGSSLSYKNGDEFLLQLNLKTNQNVFLLTDSGQCYTMPVNNLPSARGYGEPLSVSLSLQANSQIVAAAVANNTSEYLVIADNSCAFIVDAKNCSAKTKIGKSLLNTGNARALDLLNIDNCEDVFLMDNQGKIAILPIAQIAKMSKGKGRSLVVLPKKEYEKGRTIIKILALKKNDILSIKFKDKVFEITPEQRAIYRLDVPAKAVKLDKKINYDPKTTTINVLENNHLEENSFQE